MKTTPAISALLTLLLAGCANLTPVAPATPAASTSTAPKADQAAAGTTTIANAAPKSAAPAAGTAKAQDKVSAKNEGKEEEGDEEEESKPDPNLPLVKMTAEMMYKILGSELAAQRGQWQTGFVTLQALAQQTRDPRLARRAMEIAISAKQMNEALVAVRLWRELSPKAEETEPYYLALAVMQDKLGETLPIFAKRLKEASVTSRGNLMLSIYQRYLSQAKDKNLLFTQVEELFAPYMNLAEAHQVLAQAALSKGDQNRARQEAAKALAINPDSELALMTYVYVVPAEEASNTIQPYLAKHPNAYEVRQSWARMLVDRKQFAQARTQFEALLNSPNHELQALYALGVINLQLKEYPSAEKYLTRYIDSLQQRKDDSRDTSKALLMLSQLAEERGDQAKALQWLEKVKDSDSSNYFSAASRRAQLLAKNGKMDEARKLLQGLNTTSDSEKIQVLQMEAQLLRDANQIVQAYTLLDAALKTWPESAELLYDHAMAAEKLEKLNEMEASLRKVMKIAPEHHQALNALGYSLADRNIRLQEAHQLIEKALKMAPTDPFIMDSMGWVLFRMGRLKEAEETLRRAYQLRPDAEIAAHLGEVLWQSGQKDAARQLWGEAKAKDPANDTLRSTLARFNLTQ